MRSVIRPFVGEFGEKVRSTVRGIYPAASAVRLVIDEYACLTNGNFVIAHPLYIAGGCLVADNVFARGVYVEHILTEVLFHFGESVRTFFSIRDFYGCARNIAVARNGRHFEGVIFARHKVSADSRVDSDRAERIRERDGFFRVFVFERDGNVINSAFGKRKFKRAVGGSKNYLFAVHFDFYDHFDFGNFFSSKIIAGNFGTNEGIFFV